MPPANYNIAYDWTIRSKSNFSKDKRHTIATDIEKYTKREARPEPPTYSPRHTPVEKRVVGAFNLKGKRDDTSFLAEPVLAGQ